MPERDSTMPEKIGSRCLVMPWTNNEPEPENSKIPHLFHVDIVSP